MRQPKAGPSQHVDFLIASRRQATATDGQRTQRAKPAAIVAQSIMSALLLIYLVMCIKSFVDIRLRRRLTPTESAVNPPTSRV